MVHSFQCTKCGSTKLEYCKYIECTTPVELREDGTFENIPMQIDEDHCVLLGQRFCCGECGKMIEHCGVSPTTEQQLVSYLNMDPATRIMEQKQYDEEFDVQEEWEASERF